MEFINQRNPSFAIFETVLNFLLTMTLLGVMDGLFANFLSAVVVLVLVLVVLKNEQQNSWSTMGPTTYGRKSMGFPWADSIRSGLMGAYL